MLVNVLHVQTVSSLRLLDNAIKHAKLNQIQILLGVALLNNGKELHYMDLVMMVGAKLIVMSLIQTKTFANQLKLLLHHYGANAEY